MLNDEKTNNLDAIYPVGEKHPELVKSRNGHALVDLTLDNLLAGQVSESDFGITAEGLRLQAEIAEKYLRKGKQVMIEGRIQYREYTGQDGVKKTACDIRCDNFVMLGRADEGGSRDSGGYGGKASGGGSQDFEDHGAPSPAGASGSFQDDDIPF